VWRDAVGQGAKAAVSTRLTSEESGAWQRVVDVFREA